MKFEEYVGKHKLVRFSAFLAGFQALLNFQNNGNE